MAVWRATARLGSVLGSLFDGVRCASGFERLPPEARHAEIRRWSVGLLRGMGVQHQVHGQAPSCPALVVANHVSWLDIAALHAGVPQARFVSKADVLRWPLIGRMVRASGSLFIQRESKRDALRVVHDIAGALSQGDTVAVFPEGTTGCGAQVMHFHANLLQAAIRAGGIVQPVVLHYTEPGQPVSVAAPYTGQISLVASIWRIVSARQLAVHVHFLPPIDVAAAQGDRRVLAEMARERIAGHLAGLIALPSDPAAA